MGVDTVQGWVGPQVALDGPGMAIRQTRDGAVGTAEVHGRYYEQTYRKNTFTAKIAAGTVTVVGTSMTGLILINKSTTINMVLQKWSVNVPTTSASATDLVLAWFNTTGTFGGTTLTPLASPVPGFLGSSVPQGGAYTAVNSTTGAPVGFWDLLHNTAAIATTGEDPGAQGDFEGSIIVPPNFGVCLASVGASATVNGSIQWEEVPV